MKSEVSRYIEVVDGKIVYTPWYSGRGVFGSYIVDRHYIYDGGEIPEYLGIAYEEWDRYSYVLYRKPLHLVARYWMKYVVPVYWGIIRSVHWVGLIDTGLGERFVWDNFFRIKSH